jgi:ABC-type antimicrobial peptide transport system ATPase subunit
MQSDTLVIPKGMSKGKLKKLLNGFSTHTVQKEIIEAIALIRKVSIKEARDTKTVYPGEVQEILSRFK